MFSTNFHEKSSSSSDHIKLNIGGTRFETYLATLQRDPDSLLGTMFADRNSSILKSHRNGNTDEYFFDRNASVFQVILDYCRTGKLIIPPGVSMDYLSEEIDFWQIGSRKPPILSDSKQHEEYQVSLSTQENEFCDWLTRFSTTSRTAEEFSKIFKQHHILKKKHIPFNDLLHETLEKKGLGSETISCPSSRRTSLSSLSTVNSTQTQHNLIFNLSPSMQVFLERTLSIMADAKASNIHEIKVRVDTNGDISGIPAKLDRVSSQKQFWQTLSTLIHKCVGIVPPPTSFNPENDIRSQLQNMSLESQNSSRNGPFSLPQHVLKEGLDTRLIGAWEATEELFEYKLALQERFYGKPEEFEAEEFKSLFNVVSVRKTYPTTEGSKLRPIEFLSHWEVTICVP